MPHIRALQVRINPLEKDLSNFNGYTPEEEAMITKILAHSLYSHGMDKLNLNVSEIHVVMEYVNSFVASHLFEV